MTLQLAKYDAVLFPVEEAKRTEAGPALTGQITLPDGTKTPFAAFTRVVKDNPEKKFYSLTVGKQGETQQFGVLFVNERKNNDKSPDYTGTITLVKGTEQLIRVTAWKRTAKESGNKFLSILISPPNERGEYTETAAADAETEAATA